MSVFCCSSVRVLCCGCLLVLCSFACAGLARRAAPHPGLRARKVGGRCFVSTVSQQGRRCTRRPAPGLMHSRRAERCAVPARAQGRALPGARPRSRLHRPGLHPSNRTPLPCPLTQGRALPRPRPGPRLQRPGLHQRRPGLGQPGEKENRSSAIFSVCLGFWVERASKAWPSPMPPRPGSTRCACPPCSRLKAHFRLGLRDCVCACQQTGARLPQVCNASLSLPAGGRGQRRHRHRPGL